MGGRRSRRSAERLVWPGTLVLGSRAARGQRGGGPRAQMASAAAASLPSTYKVVLLGEGRVGKTSLLLRYVNNVFSDSQQATIQASYLTKRLTVEGTTVQLAVWDTAGQERFHALGPIYYRDADAALLVYDITDVDSFERVKTWVKELRTMAGKDIVLVIAGNKVDMERNRQVGLDDAESYASSIDAAHFGTSAKANKGVEQAFLSIVRKLIQRSRDNPALSSPAHKRGGMVIIDEPRSNKKKSECC